MAPDRAYPGDAYVDYVGADVYDNSWIADYRDPVARWKDFVTQPYGLQWQSDFATAHGKPMTFPEWGLSTRSDGHGGGDDPYFIQQMYDWISTHDVAHADYFEYDAPDGRHSLMNGQFPNAAAKFQALFGAGCGRRDRRHRRGRHGRNGRHRGRHRGHSTLITSPPSTRPAANAAPSRARSGARRRARWRWRSSTASTGTGVESRSRGRG